MYIRLGSKIIESACGEKHISSSNSCRDVNGLYHYIIGLSSSLYTCLYVNNLVVFFHFSLWDQSSVAFIFALNFSHQWIIRDLTSSRLGCWSDLLMRFTLASLQFWSLAFGSEKGFAATDDNSTSKLLHHSWVIKSQIFMRSTKVPETNTSSLSVKYICLLLFMGLFWTDSWQQESGRV